MILLLVLLLPLSVSASTGSIIRESERAMKLRDPFKRPALKNATAEPRTELEMHPVADMKLVGIMTGPDRLRAMIRSPDGKTHLVSEKVKIGTRNGHIRKITASGVLVVERIVNVLGEEEDVQVIIPLNGEAVAGKQETGGVE